MQHLHQKVFAVFVEILCLTTVASSHVAVVVSDPSSSFGCGTKTVPLSFQVFVSKPCPGKSAEYERYVVAQEDLPDDSKITLLSNDTSFIKCADLVTISDGSAFIFTDGVCKQLKAPSNLICQSDGQAVYVRKNRPQRRSDLIEQVSDEVYKAFIPTPFLVSVGNPIRETPVGCEDPAPKDNEFALLEGGKYSYFDMRFLDLSACAVPGDLEVDTALVYFNPSNANESTKDYVYLLDYCGGSIPFEVQGYMKIYTHRGYGCKHFPDVEVEGGCTIQLSFADNFYMVVSGLTQFAGEDSCGGIDVVFSGANENKQFTDDFCDEEYSYKNLGNHSIHFTSSGEPTRPKIGFVFSSG